MKSQIEAIDLMQSGPSEVTVRFFRTNGIRVYKTTPTAPSHRRLLTAIRFLRSEGVVRFELPWTVFVGWMAIIDD